MAKKKNPTLFSSTNQPKNRKKALTKTQVEERYNFAVEGLLNCTPRTELVNIIMDKYKVTQTTGYSYIKKQKP